MRGNQGFVNCFHIQNKHWLPITCIIHHICMSGVYLVCWIYFHFLGPQSMKWRLSKGKKYWIWEDTKNRLNRHKPNKDNIFWKAFVGYILIWKQKRNIARGTTDPGYWLCILSYLLSCDENKLWRLFEVRSQHPGSVVPLAMFLNFFSTFSSFWIFTCISSNFGHRVASLVLVPRKFCTLPHVFFSSDTGRKYSSADNHWEN